MKHTIPTYQRHRFPSEIISHAVWLYHRFCLSFPSEIISHAVWLYHRFCLSFREVEELLAERGITVTYETIGNGARSLGRTMLENSKSAKAA